MQSGEDVATASAWTVLDKTDTLALIMTPWGPRVVDREHSNESDGMSIAAAINGFARSWDASARVRELEDREDREDRESLLQNRLTLATAQRDEARTGNAELVAALRSVQSMAFGRHTVVRMPGGLSLAAFCGNALAKAEAEK